MIENTRRLIALQEETTAALREIGIGLNRLANTKEEKPSAGDLLEQFSQMKAYESISLGVVDKRPVDNGQAQSDVYSYERIVESGKEYTRKSHPLLFAVVDYLEKNISVRDLGVRVIAEKFTQSTGQSVSKSWAAVAKNYWKSQA